MKSLSPREVDSLETPIEEKVIDDLEAASDDEGKAQQAWVGQKGSSHDRGKEDPVVRAIPVMPAAAVRSSGLTTAIV